MASACEISNLGWPTLKYSRAMTQESNDNSNSRQPEQGAIFLRHFGELEKMIRGLLGFDERTEFSKVLRDFSSRLPSLRPRIAIIEDIADLRNVIAHGTELTGKAIPTMETISALKDSIEFVKLLTDNVKQFFRDVVEFAPADPLSTILKYMHQNDFSQVAVRQDRKLDILTAIDVTNWLASQVSDGIVSIDDAKAAHIIPAAVTGRFIIVRQATTVGDVARHFAKAVTQEYNNLFCAFITANGLPNEKALGIITPWDLLQLPRVLKKTSESATRNG